MLIVPPKNKKEIPKYTCHHDFEQVPEPSVQTTPRTVREINIPVKDDEELRSVNDQLRKLPSTRTHTLESTVSNKIKYLPFCSIFIFFCFFLIYECTICC